VYSRGRVLAHVSVQSMFVRAHATAHHTHGRVCGYRKERVPGLTRACIARGWHCDAREAGWS
jgi:hypothetical protein